ncbi:hypothetical protein LTR95_012771 [Oleoguttula sp. CCFEE 5521]
MIQHVTVSRNALLRVITLPCLFRQATCARCLGTTLKATRSDEEDSSHRQGASAGTTRLQRHGRLRTRQGSSNGARTGHSIRPSTRPAPRIEHVPFEGATAQTAVVDSALSDGSTVTPSERRAFESLLAMRRVGSVRADLDDSEPAGIRGKQNSGAPGHETNDAQNYEAQGSDLEASRAAGPSLDARSAAEIKTVNSLMADAQTDADLWRILQERVISRVLALQLDTPQKSAEDLDKARTPPKKAKGKKSKIVPVPAAATPVQPAATPTKDTSAPSAQDSHLLTQTFPIHLLNFTKNCASSFPGSSLPSSLLPYIKSLGPTTFAMAATTSLYNHHMSQLYYQYLDVPSIVATLEEMDQQVYEFDTATYNLLGKILHRASEARLGHLGPGTQALWDGERLRSALKGIADWKAKVLAQMEARALQDARSRITTSTILYHLYIAYDSPQINAENLRQLAPHTQQSHTATPTGFSHAHSDPSRTTTYTLPTVAVIHNGEFIQTQHVE